MNTTSTPSDGCSIQAAKEETLGESLDRKIAEARLQLEKLCVTKAKAEALQMLNTPMSFVMDCVIW